MFDYLIPPAQESAAIVRLRSIDRLVVAGERYIPSGRLLTGYHFVSERSPDARPFLWTHGDILEKIGNGAEIVRGEKLQSIADLDLIYAGKGFDDFSKKQQLAGRKLKKLMDRYNAAILRGEKLPRSDNVSKKKLSGEDASPKFQDWLNDECRKLNYVLKKEGGETSEKMLSTSQFNRLYLRYEAAGRNILAIMPRHKGPGQKTAPWTPEAYAFALNEAGAFKSDLKPEKMDVFEWYLAALWAENERRKARGQDELYQLGKTKFYEIIDSFPAFDVMAGRFGEAYAREHFSPNMASYHDVRPGSLVQMDEWKGDMLTLVAKTGQYKDIPPGLHKFLKKIRIWLVVAICVATRAVLAVHAVPKPNAQAAIDTLRMVMSDKTRYAQLAGATMTWKQRVSPEQLHVDNGSAFISEEFKEVLDALGIKPTFPPAKKPKKRPHIESLFHVIGPKLTAFFHGRTFSSIAEKGDYDARKHASLLVGEFVDAFRLGVVDIYHLKAHGSLGGRSPHNVWIDACSTYEWDPPPTSGQMLDAFGKVRTASIGSYGIVRRDISYWNDDLIELFKEVGNKPVKIKEDASNIASILVQGKDGDWFQVENKSELEDGVTAQQWDDVRAEDRRRNKEETDRDNPIRHQATNRLREMGHAAAKRSHLPPIVKSQEKIESARAQVYTGYDEGPMPGTTRPNITEVFDELRDGPKPQPNPAPEAPAGALPAPTISKFDRVREED